MFFIFPCIKNTSGATFSDYDGIRAGKYGTRKPMRIIRLISLWSIAVMFISALIIVPVLWLTVITSKEVIHYLYGMILAWFILSYWVYLLADFKATVGDIKYFIRYIDCGPIIFKYLGMVFIGIIIIMPHDLFMPFEVAYIFYVMAPMLILFMVLLILVMLYKTFKILFNEIKE